MHRLLAFLVVVTSVLFADDEASSILGQIRLKVAEQVKGSANYTCVQAVDRTYWRAQHYEAFGCEHHKGDSRRKEVMHDRLRLDIAVSEGHEIYSWHGGSSFSSGGIADVVRSGPISSGSFVGYLQNIFLVAGIRFEFRGRVDRNGIETYKFDYWVPLAVSHHDVAGRSGTGVRVPFHGTFFADCRTLELVNLDVILDQMPPEVEICNAEIDMNYGTTKISDHDALIPQIFSLRMEDASHLYTISTSEYSSCREFRGESTVHFELNEAGQQNSGPAPSPSDEWFPAGISLHVRLLTPITENTAFTGDRVEGVLLEPVRLSRNATKVIPKGAVLGGIITLLEKREEPYRHFLYSIEFDHLTFADKSMRLKASPKPTHEAAVQLGFIYGHVVPAWVEEQYRNGIFVAMPKLRLDQHFSGEWQTVNPPPGIR